MAVLGDGESHCRPVFATRQHDGDLGIEFHPPLQDARLIPELGKPSAQLFQAVYRSLPFPIVPQTAGLEQGRGPTEV